jgi:ABC-type Zn2+ transport system substrate-binding protein/surface adhesin
MLIIGLLIGGVVAGFMFIDEGELVTLYTRSPNGDRYGTQLWVIEEAGDLYVRAHYPGAKWLARIRDHREVELHRGEASQSFFAWPADDPEVRRAVNRAMAAKYGLADRLASSLWNPEKSVPVHLHGNNASAQQP